jgi:hypothetical protein
MNRIDERRCSGCIERATKLGSALPGILFLAFLVLPSVCVHAHVDVTPQRARDLIASDDPPQVVGVGEG